MKRIDIPIFSNMGVGASAPL